MNKIVLITTRGCEGCSVMRYSINSAILYSSKEIEFESKDVSTLDIRERNNLKLRDFPTTLFYKDDILVRKEVGTRPYIVVLRWIDIDFK